MSKQSGFPGQGISHDQARRVESDLYRMLGMLELLNGDRATKLENLVRYAWDEARDEVGRCAQRDMVPLGEEQEAR